MTEQLALPFRHAPSYAEVDFVAAASNQGALAWLAPESAWPSGRLAIWGQPGVGKTHLLRIWASRVDAVSLSGASLRGLPARPDRPVALDDADAVTDEPALLHLLNAAAEANLPVLLAARAAPARWSIALPDLRSRLRAITAVEISAPDDDLLDRLLSRLLSERQLAIPEHLQRFLRERLPRSPEALSEAVRRIDQADRINRVRLNEIVVALQAEH